jgi:hypothetical protein
MMSISIRDDAINFGNRDVPSPSVVQPQKSEKLHVAQIVVNGELLWDDDKQLPAFEKLMDRRQL